MREREDRVRKAEEGARVMEAKAREERELCMKLMASAKVGHGGKGQEAGAWLSIILISSYSKLMRFGRCFMFYFF